MGGSIWNAALDAARDILEGLIGDLLGWLIIIAVLAPFVVILYFVLKKIGWRGAYPGPYRKTLGVVRMTLGPQQLSDETVNKMLADPKAGVQTVRLDAADPQARAKLRQIMQLLGSVDPKMEAKLGQAILGAEAAPARANLSPPPAPSIAAEAAGAPETSAANVSFFAQR